MSFKEYAQKQCLRMPGFLAGYFETLTLYKKGEPGQML